MSVVEVGGEVLKTTIISVVTVFFWVESSSWNDAEISISCSKTKCNRIDLLLNSGGPSKAHS